ncbi:MAG: carboxypeptidase-like regulatory domain-containing protein [Chitinophagaceae bacterium]|nr:carboxypeptidase-like regulatory domain-containing protein [Chitinophagaceae bacterium]
MKKMSWLFLMFAFPAVLLAQGTFRVAGKVIDAVTQQPLQGASVFCQNTTIGTVSNAEGNFHLTLNNGGYDLAVSFMGMETQSIRISDNMPEVSSLVIEMKAKEKSLEEVAIVATTEVRNGWEKYGGFLKDNFIGKTANSKECTIDNPEVLRFFYSKKKNRLKVITDSILVIRNKALGYVIKYQLDSFVHEYNDGKTLYTGFPFYEEMEGSVEEKMTWKEHRLKAYNGSVLQFMRAYRDSTLRKDGYKIEMIDDNTNKSKPVMNPYDTTYYDMTDYPKIGLFFPGKLRVVYSEEKPDPAYLTVSKLPLSTPLQISILDLADGIVIEENGFYFDQKDVLTLGYWAWEKMADFLPYNYYPNQPFQPASPPEPVVPPAAPVDSTSAPVPDSTAAPVMQQ